jgi:hypothetical protein
VPIPLVLCSFMTNETRVQYMHELQ